ncbi:hypothetical protein ACFLQN_02335 [Candidatus Aenigmatarchaeota archaeon]
MIFLSPFELSSSGLGNEILLDWDRSINYRGRDFAFLLVRYSKVDGMQDRIYVIVPEQVITDYPRSSGKMSSFTPEEVQEMYLSHIARMYRR